MLLYRTIVTVKDGEECMKLPDERSYLRRSDEIGDIHHSILMFPVTDGLVIPEGLLLTSC